MTIGDALPSGNVPGTPPPATPPPADTGQGSGLLNFLGFPGQIALQIVYPAGSSNDAPLWGAPVAIAIDLLFWGGLAYLLLGEK